MHYGLTNKLRNIHRTGIMDIIAGVGGGFYSLFSRR
jgi:hypothetical protein